MYVMELSRSWVAIVSLSIPLSSTLFIVLYDASHVFDSGELCVVVSMRCIDLQDVSEE
jgi:hypothetical protein